MQNYIYLGPYITCKNTIKGKEQIYKYKVCSKENCKNDIKSNDRNFNFCSLCGSNTKEVIEKYSWPNPIDIYDLLGEGCNLIEVSSSIDLKDREVLCFIARQSWLTDEPEKYFNPNSETVCHNLSKVNMQERILHFLEEYAQELEIIKENYTDIELCWGVLNIKY